jgi:hypothetical protein
MERGSNTSERSRSTVRGGVGCRYVEARSPRSLPVAWLHVINALAYLILITLNRALLVIHYRANYMEFYYLSGTC